MSESDLTATYEELTAWLKRLGITIWGANGVWAVERPPKRYDAGHTEHASYREAVKKALELAEEVVGDSREEDMRNSPEWENMCRE